MSTFDRDKLIGVIGFVVGIMGVGYAIGTHTKMAKVSDRLDRGIDELAKNMDIDIPEELTNKALEKAVAIEAKKAVEKAASEALSELKRDIHATVSIAVDREYESIKDTVLKKATDEASKIDAARVRRDIEKAAYNAAMDKFNDNLDDALGKFNDNLNNLSKIYSSMAGVATRNPDKEITFKLG
jgi:type VI protein secretion system component VasK